ncbi:hypothetical protein TRFO_10695 [Tritrichomonas foetus]|uniref:Uncharacterized protein n=1 Tax=Tritrichomonas foetus TaxID=1144522 RepID=A0A1J4JBH1_9EUKA|nr:hypothetical protein TRFO_10695 [Tritrichomonas foetus]|eukprot:OHS95003.1 hypothetical protein TRFO_10695 [Tritrichomonas foetus]
MLLLAFLSLIRFSQCYSNINIHDTHSHVKSKENSDFSSVLSKIPSTAIKANHSDLILSNPDDWEQFENGTYRSKQAGATISYQFIGTRIWVEGLIGPNLTNVYIFIDEVLHATIYQENETHMLEYFLFSSTKLDFKKHTIKIVGQKAPIEISNVYYVEFLIPEDASPIPESDFVFDVNWKRTLDGHYTSTSDNATVTVNFTGDQFWITGTLDPSHRTMEIFVDGQSVKEVSQNGTRTLNYIFYESDVLSPILPLNSLENDRDSHQIQIVTIESPIEIADVFVIKEVPIEPPLPTPLPTPSPTPTPQDYEAYLAHELPYTIVSVIIAGINLLAIVIILIMQILKLKSKEAVSDENSNTKICLKSFEC